ncbi:MAG: glycosyltransferase [Thermus sp.]|uniref:glycosyltransferase n=1 Tax=Thermus sp. TaxID=275 RepID=UPI0025D78EFD|nr:glycosyltransferase [Thermus sp.]MCS7219404.1 glycosyltransferase [Thermus sp.]
MSGDFFFGVFLFLLLRLLALLYNLLRFPRLRPAPTPSRPTASLLVPARNEAANLPQTLPALLRQGALEVLVLDDASEDGTPQVAEALGGGHPGFRLLRGQPLPPGWTGKNWACWQLAQAARGEVLIFTDADVLWEEGALGGLLEALEGQDLLSALPRQEVGENPLVGATVPFVMGGLFSFLPHPFLEELRVANGQVLAFRREAYLAMGGHQAVRGEVLEDVALAKRVRRYRLALGHPLFRTRMYRGYGEVVEGFGKNFLEIHLHNPLVLLGSAFYHLALYTLPWLCGRLDLGLWGLLERVLVQKALGGPLWPGLLAPLAPLLLLPAYLRALLPGKRWKGRAL